MTNTLSLVDASIKDIQDALSAGALTSVDLVARYLRRVAAYDCRGLALNAVPVLNDQVFAEAAASDERRRCGQQARALEGIPFTVKDSYKVKGMPAASGSPAFKNLIANQDAFTVAAIRSAGGVLLGRTNTPPVAYGGMQRGVYGRAENPYNPEHLAAAWASGSSNGSAVSTAASMAAFGMGEETVSSGRSPASNNALVAYTPSRGWISIRGNWPLYPTCDVVVPHTRTMDDMVTLLAVISAEDDTTAGDFWRDQPFVKLQQPWGGLPRDEIFTKVGLCKSLQGLRVAIPIMYSGGSSPKGAGPVYTHPEVQQLLEDAKAHLESLGAEVVTVPDFPPVTGYENPDLLPAGCPRLPDDWNWYERGPLVAHGWDQFLRDNGDADLRNLAAVDEMNIWPHSMRTEAELKHFPPENAIHWGRLAGYVLDFSSLYDMPNLEQALNSLEDMREQLCDDYLQQHNCDCFVFPAQGDVAPQDSDVDPESAAHAWTNGVWYSNGNRALRHLGMPSVTVPMGIIESKAIPVGLTFAGKAYDDLSLLQWANAFEWKSMKRTAPRHTPPLPSDLIELSAPATIRGGAPILSIQSCEAVPSIQGQLQVTVTGSLTPADGDATSASPEVLIAVNGQDVPAEQITIAQHGDSSAYDFSGTVEVAPPPERNDRERTMVPVSRDKTMVVVLARSSHDGCPAGHLALI